MEQTNTQPPTMQTLLAWSAPILPSHNRGRRWYVVGSVLVLSGTAYGILSGSWPLAIVILLCGAMYFILRGHVPEDKEIAITNQGVMIDRAFLRWEDTRGYWLLQTNDYTELHFTPKAKNTRDLIIQTKNQDLLELKTALGSYIPELTDKHETLLDMIIRICKL